MLSEQNKKIFEYFFNELRLPKVVENFEDYDYVYDNSLLAGIVSRALKGKNIKKFRNYEYLDEEFSHFKNLICSSENSVEREEAIHYFETYEQVAKILKTL